MRDKLLKKRAAENFFRGPFAMSVRVYRGGGRLALFQPFDHYAVVGGDAGGGEVGTING